ncbi:PREDICTED: tubulin polyglutamylase complex subunit 2, partial [Thamnophis sirtalis]|uniref:Tubulin polyglutamylase complex subunit 2 n=1 Tax=Thamnophis sirtalis TaxID=35019 RepID=A0A6I9WW37_9SAUR
LLAFSSVSLTLVPSPASEIWFLDRALYWHFLTSSFIAYYRLMVTHLGLPQWQYFFTGYGLSPQAKQWFNMYKPITVHTEQLWEADEASVVNKLDPNKVFRNKASLFPSLVKAGLQVF